MSKNGTNSIVQAAAVGLLASLNSFISEGAGKNENAKKHEHALKHEKKQDLDDTPFTSISTKTDAWTTNNFQNFFNYVYSADASSPPALLPNTTVVGFDEILVWAQTNYGGDIEIQDWINAQLSGQINTKLLPSLAKEMVSVINFAFQTGSQTWDSDNKTIIMPLLDGKATVYFDYVILSSYATDSNGQNPSGIARITGVLYYGPNNPTKNTD